MRLPCETSELFQTNALLQVLEVMWDEDVALCLTPQAFSNIHPTSDIWNNINLQVSLERIIPTISGFCCVLSRRRVWIRFSRSAWQDPKEASEGGIQTQL